MPIQSDRLKIQMANDAQTYFLGVNRCYQCIHNEREIGIFMDGTGSSFQKNADKPMIEVSTLREPETYRIQKLL